MTNCHYPSHCGRSQYRNSKDEGQWRQHCHLRDGPRTKFITPYPAMITTHRGVYEEANPDIRRVVNTPTQSPFQTFVKKALKSTEAHHPQWWILLLEDFHAYVEAQEDWCSLSWQRKMSSWAWLTLLHQTSLLQMIPLNNRSPRELELGEIILFKRTWTIRDYRGWGLSLFCYLSTASCLEICYIVEEILRSTFRKAG